MADPMPEPVSARCDHCKQTRVLFLYEPLHAGHFTAAMVTCRWCNWDKNPLLCSSCWSKERLLEENDPGVLAEAEVMSKITASNRRYIERQAADIATCEAIAEATEADHA